MKSNKLFSTFLFLSTSALCTFIQPKALAVSEGAQDYSTASLATGEESFYNSDLRLPIDRPILRPRPRCSVDPAVTSIDFSIVRRYTQFTGLVRITVVVKNLGISNYVSGANQQGILLYSGTTLLKSQPFGNLAPGQTATLTFDTNWNSSSPAEGEFPPTFKGLIVYDPDITLDGNAQNDDCSSLNNQKSRSGADVNGMLR